MIILQIGGDSLKVYLINKYLVKCNLKLLLVSSFLFSKSVVYLISHFVTILILLSLSIFFVIKQIALSPSFTSCVSVCVFVCVSVCFRLLWKLLLPLVFLCVLVIAVLVLLVLAVRLWLQRNRNARRARDGRPTVAFFHPYCNAGGGGERVLWCALRALQNR